MPDELLVVHGRDGRRRGLNRAVERGELTRVLPGVYAPVAQAHRFDLRAAAVHLWRPDAVVCGAAAAQLTYAPHRVVEVIDIAARTTIRPARYRFSDRSIPARWRGPAGLAVVTAPALTALDLAVVEGVDALHEALRSRVIRPPELRRALRENPDRSGNLTLARLVRDVRENPWSVAERRLHRVLHGARISGWTANLPIRTPSGLFYADVAFKHLRLLVEVDGRVHQEPGAFESDRRRQNALTLAGWSVLRVTWSMLDGDPQYVVDAIRAGLRRQRRSVGARPAPSSIRGQSASSA